jgi:hypothetical protein
MRKAWDTVHRVNVSANKRLKAGFWNGRKLRWFVGEVMPSARQKLLAVNAANALASAALW